MSAEQPGAELPFPTAPEHVSDFADSLGVPERVEQRAQRIAEQFSGLEPEYVTARTPTCVAAASLYLAAKGDISVSYSAVSRATGKSQVAIRQTAHELRSMMEGDV